MERNQNVARLLLLNHDPVLAITHSHQETLQWLRNNHLLPSSLTCCQIQCIIFQDNSRLDGQEFRCPNPRCRRRFNIRTGTIWNEFRRIPLVVLVRLVFYHYVHQISASKAAGRFNRAGIQISSRTTRRIYSLVRGLVLGHMRNQVFSGVLRGTIEMDEALFTHRAGPGRRGLRQIWAIGLVERRTGLAFAFVVPSRTHAVINELVRRYVLRGSLILHDGWQGYARIPNAWRHINVNNDETFTTSQVEGLWGQLRARIRNMYSGGVVEGNIEAVLTEVLWRRNLDLQQVDTLDALIAILRI